MRLVLSLVFRPLNLLMQSVALALSQIWANKTRALLTTLGIVIGVASVTTVIAALSGLRKQVLDEFETLGTNKLFVLPDRPAGASRFAPFIRFDRELFEDLLAHAPSVRAFTRQTNASETVSHEDIVITGVPVRGIDPSWHEVENRPVLFGRRLDITDSRQNRAVCLIDEVLRDRLQLPRDPAGARLRVGDRSYTIVGVIERVAESSFFQPGSTNGEMLVPFEVLANRLGPDRLNYIVIATAQTPALSEEARGEIMFYLRTRRQIRPGEPDNFRIEFVERFVQQFNALAAAITLVATGIVGISLLVGGIGIMNIMLVSVSERTREIGLRKAVGARPSAVLAQFLIEATTLCLVGGALGLLVGHAMTEGLKSIPQARLQDAFIPGWAVLLGFGFSAGVGLIFGMFPAIKASRLDPIVALRHE